MQCDVMLMIFAYQTKLNVLGRKSVTKRSYRYTTTPLAVCDWIVQIDYDNLLIE
jgi:hypothetical protein